MFLIVSDDLRFFELTAMTFTLLSQIVVMAFRNDPITVQLIVETPLLVDEQQVEPVLSRRQQHNQTREYSIVSKLKQIIITISYLSQTSNTTHHLARENPPVMNIKNVAL
ncbi:hypothetical protein ABKN59_001522 [Abortiporus biennis]